MVYYVHVNIPARVAPEESTKGRIASVLREAGPLVTAGDAARALRVSRSEAARMLSRWSRQGWLRRIRRGLYGPVPLDASDPVQILPDPWILVPELFGPGYVGGWSAAEHWDLTEQVFRSVLVFTTRSPRPREQTIQGIPFVLRQVAPRKLFGTRTVWRGTTKVAVSDPERTIVDMMNDPSVGGGIRHAAACVRACLQSNGDLARVLDYAERFASGAVFKRLGFVLSSLGANPEVLERCRGNLTAGNAKLDPGLRCPRLVSKWRLWVPEGWAAGLPDD